MRDFEFIVNSRHSTLEFPCHSGFGLTHCDCLSTSTTSNARLRSTLAMATCLSICVSTYFESIPEINFSPPSSTLMFHNEIFKIDQLALCAMHTETKKK